MPRPASDQPPVAHPMYPDTIRLYVDRKRRGNGVVEAQYRLATGWTGYRVVGRAMPEAMRVSAEQWVRLKDGGDLPPRTATRPKATKPPKITQTATDTFAAAANLVINDLSAEQAKAEGLYGRHSKLEFGHFRSRRGYRPKISATNAAGSVCC